MKKQRKNKGFSDCDCWGLYWWLGRTFPEMILNLRNMQHGAPELKFEEFYNLPLNWLIPELQKLEKIKKEEYDIYDIFNQWYIILTRIAFCLKQTDEDLYIENPYEKEYFNQLYKSDNLFKKINDNFYELNTSPVDKELKTKYVKEEDKIWKYRNNMKNEAFDLLKKYFWNLWD